MEQWHVAVILTLVYLGGMLTLPVAILGILFISSLLHFLRTGVWQFGPNRDADRL